MMNTQHVAKMAEEQEYFPRYVAGLVRGWLLFQAQGHPQPIGPANRTGCKGQDCAHSQSHVSVSLCPDTDQGTENSPPSQRALGMENR